jgi:hypothetical protein
MNHEHAMQLDQGINFFAVLQIMTSMNNSGLEVETNEVRNHFESCVNQLPVNETLFFSLKDLILPG